MRGETEAILRRVIAKAAILRESRFVTHLVETGYRIDFREGGLRVTRPDDEARDAFIMTFRFFILQNERTSLRALARLLDEKDVSEWWKERFRALTSAINDYLDTAYGEYQYGGVSHRFSNRVIMGRRSSMGDWYTPTIRRLWRGTKNGRDIPTFTRYLKCGLSQQFRRC